MTLHRTGAASSAGGGTYDTKDIAGAAVTSTTFTGLAGDTDGGYEIDGTIVTGAASPVISLRPKSLSTNQSGRLLEADTSVAVGGLSAIRIAAAGATVGSEIGFRVWMGSKSGRVRFWFAQAFWKTAGGTQVYDQTAGEWTATSEVIDEMQVFSSIASGIGIGSKITLLKVGNPLL